MCYVFRLAPRASSRDNQASAARALNPGCNPGLGFAKRRVISTAQYNRISVNVNRYSPRKLGLSPSLCKGQHMCDQMGGQEGGFS